MCECCLLACDREINKITGIILLSGNFLIISAIALSVWPIQNIKLCVPLLSFDLEIGSDFTSKTVTVHHS